MKRFLLFGGDCYYPCGGWDDFVSDFETLHDAEAAVEQLPEDWHQIVDTKGMRIVHR